MLWEQLLRNMYADGVRIFVEIGPGSTLTSFVKKTLGTDDVCMLNVADRESLENTLRAIRE